MVSYTMNGHEHSTVQARSGVRVASVGSRIARRQSPDWVVRPLPERFRCLASPDPGVQLQDALNQIEALLERNTTLLKVVFQLGQALSEAQSRLESNDTDRETGRGRQRASDDLRLLVLDCSDPATSMPPE